MLKVYIAGPITGVENYREIFMEAEKKIMSYHCGVVMNPAILPDGFDYDEYMKITHEMLEPCDVILLLRGWQDSPGAREEFDYAVKNEKIIIFRPEQIETLIADAEYGRINGFEIQSLRMVAALLNAHEVTPDDLKELCHNIEKVAALYRAELDRTMLKSAQIHWSEAMAEKTKERGANE